MNEKNIIDNNNSNNRNIVIDNINNSGNKSIKASY